MNALALQSVDPNFGLGYALAAYAVIFVAFFGYLGWLLLSQRRLRRRLEELERRARSSADGGAA